VEKSQATPDFGLSVLDSLSMPTGVGKADPIGSNRVRVWTVGTHPQTSTLSIPGRVKQDGCIGGFGYLLAVVAKVFL
jgi:hypothetical protein